MTRSPRLREPIQIVFKNRPREKASDDELRSFLDTIEKLETLAAEFDADEKKRG